MTGGYHTARFFYERNKMKPYLGKPAYTQAVLKSHHISARKKYGQNFLIDEDVLADTVEAAGIGPDDLVLEIGPGIGTLTQYLAERAGKVIAVEIDRSLEEVLADTLSGFKNVDILWGDILKTDIRELVQRENEGRPVKVAANLPYYITTPILLGLFESGAPIQGITVMVQKEVADRIAAKPGNKSYGALTLAVRYYASCTLVRIVHPSSFIPQPGVDSAVIHLETYDQPPVEVKDEKKLFNLIRASFSQRRKKLSNGVAGSSDFRVSREDVEAALIRIGLDPGVRGEKLTLEEFARLSDEL